MLLALASKFKINISKLQYDRKTYVVNGWYKKIYSPYNLEY